MMTGGWRFGAVVLGGVLAAAAPAGAADTPKRGGTLTYLIPADAPPTFDGHRETTYATIHSVAPYYSVLIRINPDNPSSTTDFVCDLCTEMPKPADDGKTYTFKIRQGVKFHNGDPLTAEDVAKSLQMIAFPPEGVLSPRSSDFDMVDKIEAPDPSTVVIRLKFATSAFLPPAARDDLKKSLGDQIAFQDSDWNCGSVVTINEKVKPFDDVRVRRALTLAIDRWHGAQALSKIADVHTAGSLIFPGDPLAPSNEQLHEVAGFWPDIDKSRTEAKRLLKEAGAENLTFELLNRDVDQPYKYVGIWIVDEWSKIGVKVTQKVLPSGPWVAAERAGDFSVVLQANCHSGVNPLIDVQPYLSSSVSKQNYGNYEDPREQELYEKALHETDPATQKQVMFQFAKHVMDTEAHKIVLPWWYRIVPYRSYVKGWKISPSHYLNQDLANIWLDK